MHISCLPGTLKHPRTLPRGPFWSSPGIPTAMAISWRRPLRPLSELLSTRGRQRSIGGRVLLAKLAAGMVHYGFIGIKLFYIYIWFIYVFMVL